MRLINTILLLIMTFSNTHCFWWWFTGNSNNQPNDGDSTQTSSTTEMTQVFAPFEMSTGEEKFLIEAKNYLQNLPMLDQCNMLIINRLKTSCHQLSDEQLSKLSVNLLNCQSAVEGRKVYKCTEEMALSECTGPMDPDTWNSYHIISNRARAICYNMRQTQFRMKTEQTVNQLASSTLNNINLLKQLAAGQEHMQEVTEEAVSNIAQSQNKLLANQESLNEKQSQIGGLLQNNMEDLIAEKRLIAEKHHQVEQYTKMINEQLVSLSTEIKAQDQAKKDSEQEILKDLDSVKSKADEVLQKLGTAFVEMDNYHDSLEEKQNKTLKSLEEIQQTIEFMSNLIEKLHVTFNNQIPWLQNMFGGTVDKLTMISILLGHTSFFMASFFSVIFINAPSVTRGLLLLMVPVNCFLVLHEVQYQLTFLQMAWILAGSMPGFYTIKTLWDWVQSIRKGKQIVLADQKERFTFATPEKVKATAEFQSMVESSYTPIAEEKKCYEQNPTISLAKNDVIHSSSPIRNLNFPSYDESPRASRRHIDSLLNNSSPRLNTSLGLKCCAKTKSGSRCKNSVLNLSTTCRVHTPQKDL